jgi:hypothetical protein
MAEGLTPLIPYYSGMGGLYIFYTGRTKIQGTLDEEFLEFLGDSGPWGTFLGTFGYGVRGKRRKILIGDKTWVMKEVPRRS